MDLMLLELVLWSGLLFFLWALKDGLTRMESDIESYGLFGKGRYARLGGDGRQFRRPERVAEQIGTYQETAIYRYVLIDGHHYEFDRVCPPGGGAPPDHDERWVAPGLVYQECRDPGHSLYS